MTIGDSSAAPLSIAIVAGEASGDMLGAGLIAAIERRVPEAAFFGVAGERMRAAGCEAWYRAEELSVMGLAEVLRHLPRILALRRDLLERIRARQPHAYVGIDSPDFNLPVARALRAAGIPTVQYVSPQFWAWRQSRVAGIRAAVDLVLCVLPFETAFYAQHGVRAKFVGHPLADAVPLTVDTGAARQELGIAADGPVLAILPGSRRAVVKRLAGPFLATAAWLEDRRDLTTVVALANDSVGEEFARASAGCGLRRPPRLVTGRAREVMAAADAVLTASGTASLEAMLLKKPMVVAYRMTRVSHWIFLRMGVARLSSFSLPNLLAGRRIVPEYAQADVRPETLGPALLEALDGRMLVADWRAEFAAIHERLRRGADRAAAAAVLDLLDTLGPRPCG